VAGRLQAAKCLSFSSSFLFFFFSYFFLPFLSFLSFFFSSLFFISNVLLFTYFSFLIDYMSYFRRPNFPILFIDCHIYQAYKWINWLTAQRVNHMAQY